MMRIACSPDLEEGALTRLLVAGGASIDQTEGSDNWHLIASRTSGAEVVDLLPTPDQASAGRRVLCCPRPTAKERQRLEELDFDEIVEPAIWSEAEIATRLLSVVLPQLPHRRQRHHGLQGCSTVMHELFEQIERVAPISDPVLIVGETGTGKELIARAIHKCGRPGKPWVAFNIAAATSGLVSSDLFGHVAGSFTGAAKARKGHLADAGDGTVLLDEIGDLDARTQVKLLRVIEQREFAPVGSDKPTQLMARLLFATHKDLEQLVLEGTFRQDLWERIRTFTVVAPPLRSRTEDLVLLARFFLAGYEKENGGSRSLPSTTANLLFRHDWPGNVRELRNLIRKSAAYSNNPEGPIHSGIIREATKTRRSPAAVGAVSLDPTRQTWPEFQRHAQRAYFERVLEITHRKVAIAAKMAGLSKSRFYEILKDLELSP